jgi:DNA repair protein RecO (recombination protein O)
LEFSGVRRIGGSVMQENVTLTGIVIKAEPIGEYDRRVVILTKERGKISAFAKGARKAGNRLMAPTNPFSFGQFRVYEGRSSYSLSEAEISNYFEELRSDFVGAYYGMYFMEICDYYTRENNDETGMLKLLYQSLRALTAKSFDDKLVRCIFELKAIIINGEFPGISEKDRLSESAAYTVDFIMRTPPEKLFTFNVKPEILEEIRRFSNKIREITIDRNFKSLEILENIE